VRNSACQEEKKGRDIMRKAILVLAVLILASPVWGVVMITCEADGNEVTVSYDMNDVNGLIRAVALNITLDSNATIGDISGYKIGESISGDKGFGIFPGSIDINEGGVVQDYGDPIRDPCQYPEVPTLGGKGTGGMTVELGSLYYPVTPGSPNAPDDSGILLKFTVSDDCNVTIDADASGGGVVMESGESAATNLPSTCQVRLDCLIGGNAGPSEYSDWVQWQKPDCWCYMYQCRGDIDGLKIGFWQVNAADLEKFREAFFLMDPQLQGVTDGICADIDHLKIGFWRVNAADLELFRAYFFDTVIPDCDQPGGPNQLDPNTWTVYTGPYSFWTSP
jgi:hypothetical protein